MFASVLVEIGAKSVDKLFTYIIPNNLINDVKIGVRVKVPFGTMTLEGFLLEIKNICEEKYELKEIISLVDTDAILNPELLYLGKKIKEKTLCSLISAYQSMLPKALKAKNKVNMNVKKDRYIILNKGKDAILEYINQTKYKKQKEVLERLLKEERILITSLDSTINTLLKKELIQFIYEEKYRYKYRSNSTYKKVVLNEEQKLASNEIKNNLDKCLTYLLYGVTGSGKTEVYIDVIREVLKRGKSAIILVPEISLTPQIIGRFTNIFGDKIAVLHSGLTEYEKYDEYRKIREGHVSIVIGARSAIFAPLPNLGIIIIDEEHSQSYKQDCNPRYNAKDVAILRSEYHQIPLILGSATPTIESYARSLKGNYHLLKLSKRANHKTLPKVTIVDMKKEITRESNNNIINTLSFIPSDI